MGFIKTISLNEIANNALEELKRNNPNFNFSEFIQLALKNRTGFSELDEAEVNRKKRELDQKMDLLENEKQYWDDKLIEIKMQKEKEKELEAEKAARIKAEKEKKEQAKKYIKETFLELGGREMTEKEYTYYINNQDKFRHIFAFINEVIPNGKS